jgi:ribonuclease E
MLIDATHAEETRVVVLDGNRLEDFDIETAAKHQLKGNIYLAKVVRVEPSLQAAFVEYGGNRHGFLAFSEIHPDYYQIPVADRQRLLDLQAEQARLEEEEDDLELALSQSEAVVEVSAPNGEAAALASVPEPSASTDTGPDAEPWAHAGQPALIADAPAVEADSVESPDGRETDGREIDGQGVDARETAAQATEAQATAAWETDARETAAEASAAEPWAVAALPALIEPRPFIAAAEPADPDDDHPDTGDEIDMFGAIPEEAPPETIGGGDDADNDNENGDERAERRIPPRFLRNYHIQEVIHRRQILLIQVVKEERGTKGAALTTYLSLAGRFSVLMPNSPRGGGISRKITSAADRRRLKEIMVELDIPKGMGLIVRTAGAQRPKPEIKRDCEYLLRLWDDIRDHTLKSIAPALIYEEASLIKRAIRDVYSRDIDDITVDGEDAWKAAHEFMRMLMPSHARKVHLWPDQGQSLFARFQVEAQLDAMMQPTVQLRSGGYLVINQTEALVAIDVNSGRSTRERNVEETALRTNLEAADEVARQVRLRDLAGLIVIDLIDMESKRHNAMVERRMKEALKDDRARIQVGHISHFGLMEMSRQRLRPSLEETTLIVCPHCNGTGHVRGTESAALHVLRGVEEEAGKRRSAEIVVHVAMAIALYILNHKRERLNEIERRYGMRVIIAADDSLIAPRFRIERLRTLVPGEEPRFVTPDAPRAAVVGAPVAVPSLPEPIEADDEDDEADAEGDDTDDAVAAGAEDTEESREAERRRHRRRRRRGRGAREDESRPPNGGAEPGLPIAAEPAEAEPIAASGAPNRAPANGAPANGAPANGAPANGAPLPAQDDDAARRRSRRGRRRGGDRGDLSPLGVPGAEQPDLIPAYASPTPADPFGSGHVFDIFDVMEQAELNAAPVSRPAAGRRGPGNRPRWQPPHWAVAGYPAMLAGETASDRPDRGPVPESWALPSRPFMLRRDRHAPRWGQRRGQGQETRTPDGVTPDGQVPDGQAPDGQAQMPVAAAPHARPVPIEAGPPPTPRPLAAEPVAPEATTPEATTPEAIAPEAIAPQPGAVIEAPALQTELALSQQPAPVVEAVTETPAEAAAAAPAEAAPEAITDAVPEPALAEPAPAELVADLAPEPPPVPANDVVSGPVVQPIVIGSESAPPPERKRGWWRRL